MKFIYFYETTKLDRFKTPYFYKKVIIRKI